MTPSLSEMRQLTPVCSIEADSRSKLGSRNNVACLLAVVTDRRIVTFTGARVSKEDFPTRGLSQPSAQARGPRERAPSALELALHSAKRRRATWALQNMSATPRTKRAVPVELPLTLVCTDSTHGRDANLVLCARAQGGTWFSAHAHGASRW